MLFAPVFAAHAHPLPPTRRAEGLAALCRTPEQRPIRGGEAGGMRGHVMGRGQRKASFPAGTSLLHSCRFRRPIRPFSGVLFRPSAKVQRVFRKSPESFRQKCHEFSSKLPRVFGKSAKGFGKKSPVLSDNPQRFRPRPQARERKSPSTSGRKLGGLQRKTLDFLPQARGAAKKNPQRFRVKASRVQYRNSGSGHRALRPEIAVGERV